MTWSTETFKSKGSRLPCERIDRESQQYPKISTQLNFLDVTPPKSAHKYQSKRSRWPFRRQCLICCCPERKSPIYSMRRSTADNPRTPPQHQIGSETHLISTEASAWALRQLWHVPAGLCALNEKASHEQTLSKLNTTTTHNNTTHDMLLQRTLCHSDLETWRTTVLEEHEMSCFIRTCSRKGCL